MDFNNSYMPMTWMTLLSLVVLQGRIFRAMLKRRACCSFAYAKPRTSFKASGMHPFNPKLFTHGNFERSKYGDVSRFACNIC